MSLRTKIWLLVAVSVAITVGVASVLRAYVNRQQIVAQAESAARELAHDIAEDLKSLDEDAGDAELALKLHSHLSRHQRIQRLDLNVEREASTPSSRIALRRGERPEITRLASLPPRMAHHSFTKGTTDELIPPIEEPVDLKGPWKATLIMHWSVGPLESQLRKEDQRLSLLFGGGLLVVLALLSGFITDRLVGRRLEGLLDGMRDVSGGDLSRRVVDEANDEVSQLSRGFNQMLERLSVADAEIRAFNQRLASEVQAATRDLSEKNLVLAQLNRLLNDMRRENASKVRLATLGQLAAQLAHEIGTPLSSVSGHLQLALLQQDLSPQLRERLDVATREIARISSIVRDYLDSTRPLEPERKATAIGRLIEEAVEVTRGVEPGVGPAVSWLVSPDIGELITDPGLLRQVLVNLVSNGLDAVEGGGEVRVEARLDGGDAVQITVSDTGPGIAPDALKRIFEPFYTTKGRGKGTGLGLAICRQLTIALGGTINVDSEPGNGSTFKLRLPLGGPGPQLETRPRLTAVAGGRS